MHVAFIFSLALSGIEYGLVLGLMAAGLSLIYGVMGNVNTAHGTFYMLGGFLLFLLSIAGLPTPAAIAIAVAASFALGIAVIFALPANLRIAVSSDDANLTMITMLMLAIAVEYLLDVLTGGVTLPVPSLAIGSFTLSHVAFTYQSIIAAVMSAAVYAALAAFLRYSKIGKAIRAYSQNQELAEALGVEGSKIVALAFGIGVALAALSGTLLTPIYGVNSSSGWDMLVIAFIIVTLGGLGSIFGSLIGSMIYGIGYSLLSYYMPTYTYIILLVIIYVIIILKPTGIMGEIVEKF